MGAGPGFTGTITPCYHVAVLVKRENDGGNKIGLCIQTSAADVYTGYLIASFQDWEWGYSIAYFDLEREFVAMFKQIKFCSYQVACFGGKQLT